MRYFFLESPTCSGNSTSYTCSVNFFGNWVPRLNWSMNGKPPDPNSKASENSEGHLLTGTLNVSELGSPPVCEIKFARENYNGSATATNVPDYNKSVDCTLNEGADDFFLNSILLRLVISI